MLLAPLSQALSAGLDRDALWLVVRSCVLAKRTTGLAIPCLEADLGEGSNLGFVVLRPPLRPTHILVVPTNRIVGIESPVLQRPEAGAYWRAALSARGLVVSAVDGRIPSESVGMAVNSTESRSQDRGTPTTLR